MEDFIGKDQQFVTDWLDRQGLDLIVEVFKVCFLDCMHFLIAYHATTWAVTVYTLKRYREKSTRLCISRSKHMQRFPRGGAFALFFRSHHREFPLNTKNANSRRSARGGGGGKAQLELTDALCAARMKWNVIYVSHVIPRDHSMATQIQWPSVKLFTVQPATYVSLGCFKDKNKMPRLMPEMIANKRKNIDWQNMEKTVQACADEAKKRGYNLVQ